LSLTLLLRLWRVHFGFEKNEFVDFAPEECFDPDRSHFGGGKFGDDASSAMPLFADVVEGSCGDLF
jgi:hypothetical protein